MARHHASSPEADWGGLGCGLRRTQDVFFFKVSLPRRPAQDVLGRPRIDWGFALTFSLPRRPSQDVLGWTDVQNKSFVDVA